MKKSIFLFFAAILCAMTANAETYYYSGGKSNWNKTEMTASSDGYYSYYGPVSGDHQFKIGTSSNQWAYNHSYVSKGFNNTDITDIGDWGSDNCYTWTSATHYILVYYPNTTINSDSKVKICASTTLPNDAPSTPDPTPDPEPVEDVTVHFINSVEWAAVACHHWVEGGSGTTWPGDVLSKTDEIAGYDVYTATFTGEHVSCIFNNNNNGNQTANLTVEDGKYYEYNTNTWYADKAAAEAALATPIPDETVYLINTGNWSKAMIHTWNGSAGTAWPGVEMTLTGETIEGYAVYSYTAKQGGQANLLFQESENVNKTGDLTWEAGKYYAPLKNEWYDTKEAAAEALAAPVEYEYVYLINTNDWAAAHIYTWTPEVAGWPGAAMTLEAEQIAGKDVYSYKVVKGTTFGGLNFNCGGDECKTGDLQWQAGKYYAPSTGEWYADAAAAEAALAAVVTYDYYIAGPLAGGWNATQMGMEKVAEGQYTCEFTKDAGDYQFKVTNGKWGNETGGFDCADVEGSYEEVSNVDGNVNVKLTTTTTFTVKFDSNSKKISFEGLTPAETKYYIAGTQNLTGFDWQVDGLEMIEDAGVYKHTFSALAAGTFEFKVTNGTWTNPWGYSNLGAAYEEVSEGTDGEGNPNDNIKFVTEEAKNITVIFDPATGKITIDGLTEKAPVVSTYALMGVNGDWTTGITMTVNPDNADEYVLKAQSISSTDAIKVLETAGSTQTWHNTVDAYSNATYTLVDDGFGGKNIVLPAGTYNFYFKKINNEIYIEEVYVRDVTNTYGTICLPYASNSYDGAIFYRVAGKETGKVYLESVSALEAGVPYIFEKTASKIVVARNGDPVATAGSANGLVGTFTDETVVAAGNYILYNNQLRPSDGGAKVNANRAYLVMSEVSEGAPQQLPGRRYIGMSVQGENEATGFENITAPEGQVLKTIVNGQLVIIRDGEMYNAQGVRF